MCDGDGTSCLDCNGVLNGPTQYDCTGVCGGSAVEDCAGECDGNSEVDACGMCDGYGAIYGNSGDCCEEDLDECMVCGDGIGIPGPGLAYLGDCAGDDVGCDEYNNDGGGCGDSIDGLTCYWGGWCDCSGEMIEDCNNRCP
jgi:hypothetical protein